MPSEARVERALAEIRKGSANFDYFFDSLPSADWIKPLATKNVFRDPPAVEKSDEGWIRIPGWTASKYLARMAALAPEEVLEVALSIKTDNERIHSDLTEAARAMPGPLAARWAEREITWLRGQRYLHVFLDDQLAHLIAHLVETGEVESAFSLADELLRVYPPPDDVENRHWVRREASAQVSTWDYRRILETARPALTRGDPSRVLALLARSLTQALEWATIEPTGNEDFSYVWRPHISDQGHIDAEIEQVLVSALRDAARQSLDEGLLSEPDLVLALQRYRWPVIRRVLLHALAETDAVVSTDVLASLLLDKDEFEASLPSPEYRALLVKGFERLRLMHQQEILTWIDDGPDIGRFREVHEHFAGRAPTDEEVREYALRWRVLRLGVLADHLPADWAARYQEWVDEVGAQEFMTYSGMRTSVGPTSPYSVEDLNAMSDEELVAELDRWSPPDGWDAPTAEGLGLALSELAQREPLRMSRLAPDQRGRTPPYVHGTLSGLAQALRSDKAVEWPAVLELATWVVAQPGELPGGRNNESGEFDLGWVWTRRELASLLSTGFESRTSQIPIGVRERVWSLLEVLVKDADPSPAHEQRYGGTNMDPSTLSLNTTRGQAMHAALRYGLWVRRSMEADEPAAVLREEGFARMPELRDVLDAHLDPDRDPSVAVRAVYGQWFPWLVLLDPAWAAARAPAIFDRDDADRRAAAWGAYITLNRPYDDVFTTIEEQYRLAVAAIGLPHPAFRWLGSADAPEERLAQHLMSFYWHGRLELTSDALLGEFYRRADDVLRASAMEFIGRSLRETGFHEEQVLTRLRALWETRFAAAAPDAALSAKELGAFGWWFEAADLDSVWRLAQAEAVLRLGLRLEPNFAVFAALSSLAREWPHPSARVLRLMLEREKGDWGIDAHREQIKETLGAILAGEDAAARRLALDTVHWLGALGYRDFRSLAAQAATAGDDAGAGPSRASDS